MELKAEHVYLHSFVKEKEVDLHARVNATTTIEHRIEKLQEKVVASRQAVDSATTLVLEKERAHNELGTIDHLYAQETALKAGMSTQKKLAAELKVRFLQFFFTIMFNRRLHRPKKLM